MKKENLSKAEIEYFTQCADEQGLSLDEWIERENGYADV